MNYVQDKFALSDIPEDGIEDYIKGFLGESFDKEDVSKLLIEQKTIVKDIDFEPVNESKKIEWLGTQKELAELFIELERKGWIDKIEPNLIQAYFTKSNTISQVLKPSTDTKTGEKEFEGVFTTNYKPKFDIIRPKKQSK